MKPHPRILAVLRVVSPRLVPIQVALCCGVIVESWRHGMPWLAGALLVGVLGVAVSALGQALARAEMLREVEKYSARMTHAIDQAAAKMRDGGA